MMTAQGRTGGSSCQSATGTDAPSAPVLLQTRSSKIFYSAPRPLQFRNPAEVHASSSRARRGRSIGHVRFVASVLLGACKPRLTATISWGKRQVKTQALVEQRSGATLWQGHSRPPHGAFGHFLFFSLTAYNIGAGPRFVLTRNGGRWRWTISETRARRAWQPTRLI